MQGIQHTQRTMHPTNIQTPKRSGRGERIRLLDSCIVIASVLPDSQQLLLFQRNHWVHTWRTFTDVTSLICIRSLAGIPLFTMFVSKRLFGYVWSFDAHKPVETACSVFHFYGRIPGISKMHVVGKSRHACSASRH